jgi:hypothetical protein
MSRVALVGNAPLTRDYAALVDASDFVVRFNLPLTWGGRGGTRFDAWVIANGNGGRHFAVRRTFAAAPYRSLPSEIWFPRCVEVHRRLREAHADGFLKARAEQDFSRRIVNANGLRQPCTYFDAGFYRRSLARLGAAADPTMVPSAGFMALTHVLERFEDSTVTLVGFTFQGWPGHPWALEEAFARRLEAEGKLELLPV